MDSDNKKFDLPKLEEKILKFWEENKIFEKSLEKTRKGKRFVFYEGPPTANAAPGIHHVEARAFKDVIPRYKTMRGFNVLRRAGWDTHGLPVEIQVEKELGFKTKRDIERYGLGKFNAQAKESVWRYKEEWEKLTRRIGFWLDLKHPYITYDPLYMESLWWIIKEFWKKGYLKEDFKVVPWCPRCETGLSTHELGQPGAYKAVKENSIFVKFKVRGKQNEYLLVWTTTPWTLPANVAVAVNPKIEYTKFKIKIGSGYEYIWSSLSPPYEDKQNPEVMEKVSGKSLTGLTYEPLFKIPSAYLFGCAPEYKIISADFVSTEEGTGMVHIAPAFGDDDMTAAKNYWGEKYPLVHTVNFDGTIKKGVIGEGKFIREADKEIIINLKHRRLLYKIATYEHDYPHCWRCDTPLLYFAKNSWWVKTTAVKSKLLARNQKINWQPLHLKEGRFGEFLRELRDWAFSRERYWGTPLPIWKCEGCGQVLVVGSREELVSHQGKSSNRYILMRHGEALSNIRNIFDSRDGGFPLTLNGRAAAESTAKKLKKYGLDLIFSSELLRARQTAEIVQKITGAPAIKIDKRLNEINPGVFEGRPPDSYHSYYTSLLEKFTKRPPQGESLGDVRARMLDLIRELEKHHSDKVILLVSHEYPIWALFSGMEGLSNEEAVDLRKGKRFKDFIDFAQTLEATYKFLPRDESGEVNLHRPYVDLITFSCPQCKKNMKRVAEVADVWFDSGAMPFAQANFPFACHRKSATGRFFACWKDLLFPADYIAEAVDQTRGWFYTLLAVSTLLGRGVPYKNVISLGHVLDKNGQKMSKSKGNVVWPGPLIDQYGADTLRWYFYTINSPGEPKNFDEKDLLTRLRTFLMTLWNTFLLFDTYTGKIPNISRLASARVLDRWIKIRLEQVKANMTRGLDGYDIVASARELENFVVNDFSQWYLRRSRRRFQHPTSLKDFKDVSQTTAYVLFSLCRMAAPFTPFLSESLYQELKRHTALKELSVHLEKWPEYVKLKKSDLKLLEAMAEVRKIVSLAFKLRADAGLKIRQPLRQLEVVNKKIPQEFWELIKDEANIKEITFGPELKLDTTITPELKEEGWVREFIRNVQEMRRDLGLKPKQVIRGQIFGEKVIEDALNKWQGIIKKDTNMRELKIGGKKSFRAEREISFDGQSLWLGIEI